LHPAPPGGDNRCVRRALVLLTVLAALVLGAGCGGGDNSAQSQGASAASPARDCEKAPPGQAADGVNDEQGGSRPGTDPCAGE
jgi:hypothetical protein